MKSESLCSAYFLHCAKLAPNKRTTGRPYRRNYGPKHVCFLLKYLPSNHLRQYRAARSNQEDRKPPGLTELTPTT